MEERVARVYRFKKVLKYSLLSLLITIIGLLVFEYFRITPNNVYFTNITSNSITVSWDTKIKTDATAIYVDKANKLPFVILPIFKDRFFDTRDITKAELEAAQQSSQNQEGLEVTMNEIVTNVSVTDRGKYYTHHVEIKGLEPEKEYSFMVGDSIVFRKVKDVNNETVAKTYAVPESILTPVPAYGSVRDANGIDDVYVDYLPIVTDGIVYINYIDNTSGEVSNTFSSPLNESGNWYVDISGAIDNKGNNFKETYFNGEKSLSADILLNLGNLGYWEREDDAQVISPAEPFVINMPIVDNTEEIESSVKGRSIFNSLIKNAFGALIITCESDSDCASVHKCDNGKCVPKNTSTSTCSGSTPYSYNGSCVQCVSDTNCGTGKICTNHQCKDDTKTGEQPAVGYSEKCVFLSWCSCGMVEDPGGKNLNKACTGQALENCKEAFKTRSCKGYTSQESGSCDSYYGGTIPFGKSEIRDGKCKVCGYKTDSNGYKYVGWTNPLDDQVDENCNIIETSIVASCGEARRTIYATKPFNISRLGRLCGDGSTPQANSYEKIDYDKYTIFKWECKSVSNPNSIKKCSGSLVLSTNESTEKPLLNGGDKCTNDKGCKCFSYDGTYEEIENGDTCIDKELTDLSNCDSEIGCTCYNYSKVAIDSSCPIKPNENNTTVMNSDYCWAKGIRSLYKCEDGKCYFCSSGKWAEITDDDNYTLKKQAEQCEAFIQKGEKDNSCDNFNMYCYVPEDGYYTCKGNPGKWVPKNNSNELFANARVKKLSGEKCTSTDIACYCDGSVQFIEAGEWCKEVSGWKNCSVSGQICNKSGTTCSKLGENGCSATWCCNGPKPKSSLILNSEEKQSVLSSNTNVYAEEPSTEKYIIDQTTGLISGLEEGVYSFEVNGQTYFFDVSDEALAVNDGNVLIYIDVNENGQYDEGTDTKVSTLASEIEITTVQKNYKYTLTEGFNFVSFPFVVAYEDYRTAAGLLTQLNDVYGDVIYSISKFDGSWKVVGQNVELYDNNDFQLLPGQGYVIKVKEDVEISIPGKPVKYESETDNAPITLFPGWNLIGIYGSNVKTYTAKSMLQDINSFETVDFTANNVSKWESDVQRYEGFQLEVDSGVEMEYGFNYTIDLLKSYFVRVESGEGNWKPELAK